MVPNGQVANCYILTRAVGSSTIIKIFKEVSLKFPINKEHHISSIDNIMHLAHYFNLFYFKKVLKYLSLVKNSI